MIDSRKAAAVMTPTRSDTTDPFALLNDHLYMSLTTYRKNGEAVPTPVWFARVGERLFVMTQGRSGKVKRLAHNSQVMVAPCTVNGMLLGSAIDATGEVISQPERIALADGALSAKYGVEKARFDAMGTSGRVYIEIRAV